MSFAYASVNTRPTGNACNATQTVNWVSQCTRHTEGSNLGYADGHVKWMAAKAIQATLPAAVTP